MGTRSSAAISIGIAALVLCGCTSIPADPDGTLERVRESRVLRAGVSPSGGLVSVDGGAVGGSEADLVTAFAESLGAEVEWRPGGEEELVRAMERGELDLLVGGLTATSPWASRVSLTRSYDDAVEGGEEVQHVMAVPLGENAILVRLERFLDEAHP